MKKLVINKEAIIIPISLLLIIWFVFFLQVFIGFKECYGIIPLSFKGLRGIILAPLFHGSLQHIASNSIPLLVLSFLIFQFYNKLAYFVLINGWLISGLVVWMLPDFSFMNTSILSCHVGASGIIYVFAFFLFFSGVFRKEIRLMAISLIVVFLYGGIVWGMFPQEIFGIQSDKRISWESHLSGGVTGIILAILLRKIGPQKSKSIWEQDNYDSEYDENLWNLYKEEYSEEFFEEKNQNNTSNSSNQINYIYKNNEDNKKEKN